jgi:pyridinium-3,5-bisthiocarboxylic acid mononucleotide nickel chelatase
MPRGRRRWNGTGVVGLGRHYGVAMEQSAARAIGLHAWVDASAGVAGDMLLGALVDAGAPLEAVSRTVEAVLPDTVRLTAGETTRAGLRATKVEVVLLRADQPRREWTRVRALLEEADLAEHVRERALAVFAALADAEARVHGVDPLTVHFHEVGAWDSIADVVGVCAALESLGVEAVTGGPVAVGSGRARTAHGDVPVPVPAVLELARGWQVVAGGEGELATPTGLALLRTLASGCEDLPPMEVTAVGVGAGTRDPAGRANVVRVVVGALSAGLPGAAREPMWVLEANVDDLDPRVWPSVLADLLASGAADAWLTPILMKKGRPAHTVSVLCSAQARDGLRGRLFRHTTTFGVREHAVARSALHRDWFPVRVGGGQVRVKVSLAADGTVVHATPEFDDADAVAEAAGRPVREVLDEAVAASFEAGVVVGTPLPPRPADPE